MHEQCSPEGSQHSLKNTSWSKCNLELFNVALLVTQVVALIYLTASVNQTSMQHKSFVSLKRVVKKIEKGLQKRKLVVHSPGSYNALTRFEAIKNAGSRFDPEKARTSRSFSCHRIQSDQPPDRNPFGPRYSAPYTSKVRAPLSTLNEPSECVRSAPFRPIECEGRSQSDL